MDLYDHDSKVYKHLVSVVGFRFFKQIKDTGIVLKRAYKSEDVVNNRLFTLLEFEEDNELKWMKIANKKQFIFNLKRIAIDRLERVQFEERELLKINNTEDYGEDRYFSQTEMAAINISALKDLLSLLDKENDES